MIQIACLAVIKNNEGKILSVEQIKDFGAVAFVPGGKMEEDESCRDCLEREILEEIGVKIKVGGIIGFSETSYDGKEMLNIYYEAEIVEGKPEIKEENKHKSIRYIDIKDLYNYSNIKFIK